MNWQTKKILESAKEAVDDEGVFSYDQINKLHRLIDIIATAIDKESDCNKPSVTL